MALERIGTLRPSLLRPLFFGEEALRLFDYGLDCVRASLPLGASLGIHMSNKQMVLDMIAL